MERETVDRKNHEDLETATAEITALEKKLARLHSATSRTEREGAFLQRVLTLAERNPPNDTGHMARMDKVLSAVKMEHAEACTMEKVVDFELKHLTNHELPALKGEIERSNKYRADVLHRLRQQQRQAAKQAQKAEATPSAGPARAKRTGITGGAGRRSTFGKRFSTRGRRNSAVVGGASILEDPAVYQPYVDAYRRIKASTGVRDLDQLVEVHNGRDDALASLVEQRQQYEARLDELQAEQASLRNELASLEYTSDELGSREVRRLEEANAVAEAELHSSREKLDYVAGIVKDIKSGALHLSQLLGFSFPETAAEVAKSRSGPGALKPPPSSRHARVGPNATIRDEDVEVVMKLSADRAASMVALLVSNKDEDFLPSRPGTPVSTRSRPGSASSHRLTVTVPPVGGDASASPRSPSGGSGDPPASLAVLGLRATPRGTHLRTVDLAKTSSPATVHVLSDQHRRKLEVYGAGSDDEGDGGYTGTGAAGDDGADEGGDLDSGTPGDGTSNGTGRPTSRGASRTGQELHPRLKGYSAVELHDLIGKGLGVSTRPRKAGARTASAGMPSASTMAAVRDPANNVVNRKQWKQLATALRRRSKKATVAAADDD